MKKVNNSNRIDQLLENVEWSGWMILFIIILFGLILRLSVFTGITGMDDLAYVYQTHNYFTGNFEPGSEHWNLRLGFILPTLLFVQAFGFNEFSLVFFPLICSIFNIFLVYAIAKMLLTEKVALIAAFLLSFFPLDVFFATMVFLDTPLSVFMGLMAFFFIKGEINNQNRYYLISGLFLGFAYLTKLTGIYIILFPLTYIIIEKKFRLKYGLIFLSFLLIILAEFGYYYVQVGNPLYRFTVIQKTHHRVGQQSETQKKLPFKHNKDKSFFKVNSETTKGIRVLRGSNWYIEPIFTLTTNQEFGFFYFFILPIIIFLMVKKDEKVKILLIWMIPLFIYILYGSTSPFHFSSLRRWPRYLTPVTLPSLIILAYFINEKRHWLWNKFSILVLTFLFLTSIVCIGCFNSGPTDSYIVKKTAEFIKQEDQKNILIYWRMYWHLAPFIEYQKNNNIQLYGFSENQELDEDSVYYGIGQAGVDEARDCYVIVPQYKYQINFKKKHPDWVLSNSISRPKKFYCKMLENPPFDSFLFTVLKNKFCSNELCDIYYIP